LNRLEIPTSGLNATCYFRIDSFVGGDKPVGTTVTKLTPTIVFCVYCVNSFLPSAGVPVRLMPSESLHRQNRFVSQTYRDRLFASFPNIWMKGIFT
jgi:hypothetical protein